jgi:hypothetical protein
MAVDDAERARILNEMLSLLPAQWQRSLADDVIVSDEGVVWIRRGDPPAGPREYWVLDQTAELIATVTVPERVSLLAAEENTVWGVYTDALDVQYAVRFDIVR